MQFAFVRIPTNSPCITTFKLQVKMRRRKAKGSKIEKTAPAQMGGQFQTLSFAFFYPLAVSTSQSSSLRWQRLSHQHFFSCHKRDSRSGQSEFQLEEANLEFLDLN